VRYGCPLADFIEGAVDEVHDDCAVGRVVSRLSVMFGRRPCGKIEYFPRVPSSGKFGNL
jgi:hypothetical protein